VARPIWKGHISFGLVNIPVTLYSAEKKKDLHFNLLDNRNKAKVRYERINELTHEEVPWSETVKAYEYEDGNYVVLSEDDFKKAAVEATQTVEIEDFVDGSKIGHVYYEKPYYLVPGKRGEKGYVLLRETLRRTGKVGIARVVIRARQYPAAVIPEGKALVLNLLRFHHELRAPGEFDLPGDELSEHKISSREMEMAEQLVENMSADWTPAKYKDEYREALLSWIDQKVKSGGVEPVPTKEKEVTGSADVIDLMSKLKQSLQQTARKETAPARKTTKATASGGKSRRGSR